MIVMDHLSFGARLRQQREQKGISLAHIAEATKIKRSLLESLERDDLSHWPTGIFRRSYVRAYASAIDLDPEATVREFLELYPDTEEDVTAALAEAHGLDLRRPPMRLRYLIDSAIATLPRRQARTPNASASQFINTEPQAEAEPDAAHGGGMSGSAAPRRPEIDFDSFREAPLEADVSAVARICTRLSCALDSRDVSTHLADALPALDAIGLILWMADPASRSLGPVLAHGYSQEMLASLGSVPMDDQNAVSAAYRSSEPRIVDGSAHATGAVVTPLVTPAGCSGVLAFEFRRGGERLESVRAAATILAAQLSTLLAPPAQLADAVNA